MITIDATGLHIQTYEEILEEIITAVSVGLALSAAQTQRLRDVVTGTNNQYVRIEAEREATYQESLLAVYNTLRLEADGVNLDGLASLIGVTRVEEFSSEVSVTLAGTAATPIPAGRRVQYNPTGSVWETEADVTIGGGGTVAAVLVAEETGVVEVAASAPGDWTILDPVVGWTGVTTVEQTIVGAPTESDAELRARMAREVYRRGQGPQAAIRAAISEVVGVTYIGVWESQALSAADTDSDGIPARSINCVVAGGETSEIIQAIYNSRGGGIRCFGMAGATLEEETVTASNGSPVLIQFNRIEEIDMWIEYTITTSTSEETAPPDVLDLVDEILLEAAQALFDVGDDVLPWKLEGAVHAEEIPGIDDVQVTLSYDDGGVDPYTRAKRAIAIREQSVFDAARISGVEA